MEWGGFLTRGVVASGGILWCRCVRITGCWFGGVEGGGFVVSAGVIRVN